MSGRCTSGVASILLGFVACAPTAEPTLEITSGPIVPGAITHVHVSATDESGKIGVGSVQVTSDEGSLVGDGETVTLDAYGTAAVDFSCPSCTERPTIIATWRRNSKPPVTARLGIPFQSATGNGTGGNGFNASPARLLGPTPYLSKADSPFGASIVGFEDLEDSVFDLPGATTNGVVTSTTISSLIDSVDGDDGNPHDGKCVHSAAHRCDSLFFAPGSTGITVTFTAPLPSFAGLVWTDGEGVVTFEAFDGNGAKIGTSGPHALPDGSLDNTTGEDRFFGAASPSGVSRLHVFNTLGGIEVDHIQYGR